MLKLSLLALVVWIVGLVVGIPLALYLLFFKAERDQYALLITFIIGWPTLYWPTVGPIIAALKVRRVFQKLTEATSGEEFAKRLADGESQDVVIDIIASENHIPKWLARRVFRRLRRMLAGRGKQGAEPADETDQPSETTRAETGESQ
jgi:hypothetical protein